VVVESETSWRKKAKIGGHAVAVSFWEKFTVGKSKLDSSYSIEPEMIQHIFKPFFTVEEGARETGLGLAIAQRIVCSHGGKITVENQPGRGTSFHVSLPVQKVL
jgi:signal transduction histidine kinase